jgi:anthranilate synthase component 2
MILVLDNLDSFTFNLVLYLRELGAEVRVERSNEISAAEAIATGASGFLISPGPGRPEGAGASLDLVAVCVERGLPLLGVCLGHQAIGMALGGSVTAAPLVMHGKTSDVTHDRNGLFAGLPSPMLVTRYHSLLLAEEGMPEALIINARADDGTVQGVRHRDLPIHGVQFHPESIASEHGHALLGNFLDVVRPG